MAILKSQKHCHFVLRKGSPCDFAFPHNVEALWQDTMMGMTGIDDGGSWLHAAEFRSTVMEPVEEL